MGKIMKYALTNAFATALYVVLVASFIYSLQRFPEEGKIILIPIAMLMLLVFSAALVGTLIFGKPVMLYLDGKKKEALSLLVYTLVTLLILTVLIFILLLTLLS